MATYPNNYRSGVGFLANYSFYGIFPYFTYNAELGTGAGSRLNWHISEGATFARTSSAPDGYGMQTPFPPIRAGAMSAQNKAVVDVSLVGNLLQGGPIQGIASVVELSQSGELSMVVGLEGNSVVALLSGDNMELKLTIGLDGTGTITMTGTNNLSLIVPFDGSGIVASMDAGNTNLRGNLSLNGEWTPYTELSPENLAIAVWNILASSCNKAGTMGEKVNNAGSSSNPWAEILPGDYIEGQAGHLISVLQKLLRNAQVTDPETAIMTVYDDDSETPLFEAPVYEDAAGTIPYRGQGADRRDRLE